MFQQQVNLGPTATQHTFEILIMLFGAFLLGLWLGWMLWNKYKQEAEKLRFDVQSLTVTVDALNKEMGELKSKLSASEANNFSLIAQADRLSEENRAIKEQLSKESEGLAETEYRNRQLETELSLSFAPPAATPESIPLEINNTSDTLAEASAMPEDDAIPVEEETSSTKLEVVVETTTIIITTEEGEQETEEEASPAEEVSFEPVAEPETTASPETANVVAAAAAAGDEKDDLTVIEGIGPKIQELLFQYGIRTYRQLADAEVARLKEILSAAGSQLAMHNPGTWPAQANLAANDQWEQLKSIQVFLKGGKTPT